VPLKVRVRNFQSIEDATVVIDGLTVITGTNSAGKSAFFRALRGALTNARGHDFVRLGTKHCTVDVEDLDTGRTLTWKKGKGVNTYIVDGKELPKVGHGVPQEAQIFGVEPVKAGNSELWPQIAPQITGVSFLLHESGPAVAEAVADVGRVNLLTRALKDCGSDRRSTRSSLKVRRKDAQTLAERLEGFAGLDSAVEAVEALEKRRKKAAQIAKANANLVKLGNRVRRARMDVDALDGLEGAAAKVPPSLQVRNAREGRKEWGEAAGLGTRLRAARGDVAALAGLEKVQETLPSADRVTYVQQFRKAIGVSVGLATRYEEARDKAERAQEAQKVLAGIVVDDNVTERLGRFRKALDSARRLKRRYVECKDTVMTLDQQIGKLEAEFKRLKERAATVLGSYEECPTCGGTLDHVH
jgi:DNA repair ATPase RecN